MLEWNCAESETKDEFFIMQVMKMPCDSGLEWYLWHDDLYIQHFGRLVNIHHSWRIVVSVDIDWFDSTEVRFDLVSAAYHLTYQLKSAQTSNSPINFESMTTWPKYKRTQKSPHASSHYSQWSHCQYQLTCDLATLKLFIISKSPDYSYFNMLYFNFSTLVTWNTPWQDTHGTVDLTVEWPP